MNTGIRLHAQVVKEGCGIIMKDDLIRRQELENLLVVAQDEDFITLKEYDKFWDLVRRVPSADRPQGEWIRTGRMNIYGGIEVQCSNCNDRVMVRHLEDEWYCRHCGADMGMKGADDE